MKPIAVDEFFNFKFLSDVRLSPNGKNLCFAMTHIDRKKDDYVSYLYLRRDGKYKKLTSFGKERRFQFLDDDIILFPGKREKDDKEGISTKYYRISLSGGEAELAYEFPIPVSEVMPLPNGDMVVSGTVFPGFEELYKGDQKAIDEYLKYRKENADYEEITQLPWWWNGTTYTKGAYSVLFYYDCKKKKLRRLTAENENASSPKLSKDKDFVYYISMPVRPRLKRHGDTELCRIELKTGKVESLVKDKPKFVLSNYELGDSFILIIASDNHLGLNTDTDFYTLGYAGGRPKLITRHGRSVGSSVGTDIRYGGGLSTVMEGNTFYFTSTRFDDTFIFKLENGEIVPVVERPGAAGCFDVHDGHIVLTGLYDMRAQELYDEKGRRLSHFNDAALRGKYVAVPERLNADRGDYEVHGFVLKPINYDPAKKYPVILDVHGGPKSAYGPVFYHEMQYWASKGYFVIFCNPTGSDGRGEYMDIRGKYGTVDYEDIMAFTDAALKAYPAMDKDDMFETGGSYGGFMTNWIIGHTDRFRACASQRSISNWFSFYGVSDIGVDFGTDQNLSDPWNSPEKLWWHSPMKYADKAKTPTLFIHSFEDYRCPVDQGYQMFASLVAHGVESKMVCFRGENHELSRSGKPSHRLKRLNEITNWFDSHRK